MNGLRLLAVACLGLLAAWCLWLGTAGAAVAGLAVYVTAVVLDHADGADRQRKEAGHDA